MRLPSVPVIASSPISLLPADRFGPLGPVRRFLLSMVLAVALAAVTMDREGSMREPTPVVMTMASAPPRFGRTRPYRAHYRRSGRIAER